MNPERLEVAYSRISEMVRTREDGRKFVPIAKHLERELQALRSEEDDYERYMRVAER